jgi:hypothetical protein
MSHRFEHQIVGNAVEERPDVQIDNPVLVASSSRRYW